MAVSDSTARIAYSGAGSTGPFSIPFYFLANSHIQAVKLVGGVETTLTLTTHYTLTGAGDEAGGTLTLVTALAVGETLTIVRNVPLTQDTNWPTADPFPADSHEDAADKLVMIAQQISDTTDRTVRQPVSDPDSIGALPIATVRASKFLAFDAAGDPIATSGTDGQPASTFMDTVLDDTSAAAARGTLDVPSNAEAILDTIIDAAGDLIVGTAADTPARLAAAADVTAHATTSDIWVAREITLTGGAVTFTDIADAPYAGAVAWVKQNAAHVWTNGATFAVQGAANYTAAADDWIRVEAITVSTFNVTIFKKSGAPVSLSPITASLGADVALNNTANYFDGPSVAQGTAGMWFVSGTVNMLDTAAGATFFAKLWDGTTVIAAAIAISQAANQTNALSLSGYISNPAGNLRISVKDTSATTGQITFNGSGTSKDCTITAIRIS